MAFGVARSRRREPDLGALGRSGYRIMNLKQQEIADRLGISRGTLHRVLVGSPLVNKKTRARVEEELKSLNYIPNRAARSLKVGRSLTLGILGPARIRMANNIKLDGIYRTAEERGYSVIISYSDGSRDSDERGIKHLLSHMVDGIIVMGRGLCQPSDHFKAYQDTGKPIVSIYPVHDFECDCVYLDTAAAFERMTRYFIELGHKRIGLAVFMPRTSRFVQTRERGYVKALEKAGIPFDPGYLIYASPSIMGGEEVPYVESLETADMDYAAGFWATREIMRRRPMPTALVCASDDTAIGALRAAHIAGLRVPEDLAIIGYDNSTIARYTSPPLTTVEQPNYRMGQRAVELLLDRIEGRNTSEAYVREKIAFRLVVRESCGAYLQASDAAKPNAVKKKHVRAKA